MKVKHILQTVAMVVTMISCNNIFDEKYSDPSKVPTMSVDKMFTGVLKAGSDFVTPNYWRFFAFDNQNVGAICQTWGMYRESLYTGGYPAYTDEGWTKFQKVLLHFKVLDKLYGEASESDKTNFRAQYLAGKAFMYQCLLQTLDCWGDIPFSESGMLPISGQVVYPKLDEAKALYSTLLDDLMTISNEIASAGTITPASDFINDGNIEKWEKYVNSVLLRAAIRVSSHGDLKNRGEAIIRQVLARPLVTDDDDIIKVINRKQGDFNWSRLEGCNDWRQNRLASKAMVDRLQNDPRLPLIYDKVQANSQGTSFNAGRYVGVDTHDETATIAALVEGKASEQTCQYSYINETSFLENKNIEGYAVTPTEIALYRVEAILRNLVSGDARTEFIRGIVESVKLYARINAESDAPATVLLRSPKINMREWSANNWKKTENFAAQLWDNAQNKLQLTYEQLWLHCGIINSIQSWNTVRRTGYPVLYYPTVDESPICPNVPQRFIIPSAEWNVNHNIDPETTPESYYKKLFWAKP